MVQLFVVVPAAVLVASTTLAVKENVPAVVGFPVIAPEVLSSTNPPGSAPDAMLKV